MKAVVYHRYGSPDVLGLEEIPKPLPGDREVLIRVHAASVNSSDWDLVRGRPFMIRLEGLFRPRHPVPGADVAGTVEAAGRGVTRFRPGDEVFGDLCVSGWGGFAEYVCAREEALSMKPAGLSFEQAAALPQAGLLALQGLEKTGPVHPGETVLINGAGGGAGSFAIQMAKAFGAEVTGVDSTMKLDLMRSLGADHVLDYTRQDFTRTGRRYDLILDFTARHSIFRSRRVLNPRGRYVMVGGATGRLLQIMLLGPWISLAGSRKLGLLMHKPNRDLEVVAELVESGTIIPVIDRCYPLSETPDAVRSLGEGSTLGKAVITMIPG